MNDEKFYARLQNIARASGFAIKKPSLAYVASIVRRDLDDDASGSAILHVLKHHRQGRPDQYTTAEEMLDHSNATAIEKLEASNALTFADREAVRIAAERAKPRIELSPRELALPPETRIAIYDERMAAALAAKKGDGQQ